jgi:hypothetical protein
MTPIPPDIADIALRTTEALLGDQVQIRGLTPMEEKTLNHALWIVSKHLENAVEAVKGAEKK